MMVTVTRPLENAIKQIPDLTNIAATTSRGSCGNPRLLLNWNGDVDISQQRIEGADW